MKAFLDATLPRWAPRTWADKLAAGFSVSSTPSGDKLNALGDLMVAALQMGMIWVGQEQIPLNDRGLNRLSFYLGAGAQAQYGGAEVAVHAEDLATGEVFGARVARVAARWVAGRDA
jgi:NAD(P)H dehydrogenase (quinone)